MARFFAAALLVALPAAAVRHQSAARDPGGESPALLKQALQAGPPSSKCSLNVVNRDLGVVWNVLRNAGRALRPHLASTPPYQFELDAYGARHLFLLLDEMGDRMLRATTVDKLTMLGKDSSWQATSCRVLHLTQAEMHTIYGGGAGLGYGRDWRNLAKSLQLEELAPCMEYIAALWWEKLGQPMSTLCWSHGDVPTDKGLQNLTPRLSVVAASMHPRLKSALDRFLTRCRGEERSNLTERQLESCRRIEAADLEVASTGEPLEEEDKLPTPGRVLFGMRDCLAPVTRGQVARCRLREMAEASAKAERGCSQVKETLLPDIAGLKARVHAFADHIADQREHQEAKTMCNSRP
mmetsp:Transcript_109268/g.315789  ORF Transcript_109268/g.315789 Transcript_109268/m.315789 type:complete len:352 (+) Transcript_109268:42-1097(+)